eukprot:2538267-Pyramimonas_sp.AAC.2
MPPKCPLNVAAGSASEVVAARLGSRRWTRQQTQARALGRQRYKQRLRVSQRTFLRAPCRHFAAEVGCTPRSTVESTVMTSSSRLVTKKINSPVNYSRASYVRVEPYSENLTFMTVP